MYICEERADCLAGAAFLASVAHRTQAMLEHATLDWFDAFTPGDKAKYQKERQKYSAAASAAWSNLGQMESVCATIMCKDSCEEPLQ